MAAYLERDPPRFQYPQADRRGCNGVYLLHGEYASPCFSIHKRIEGGATDMAARLLAAGRAFQYPQADRRGCNIWVSSTMVSLSRVSVSTSGSKGVQLSDLSNVPPDDLVSVSTSGSKGVQRGRKARCSQYVDVSVSTSGSKGVQRLHIPNLTGSTRTFQYPQADRRGCNRPPPTPPPTHDLFQYPQADRRGCNNRTAGLTSVT